MGRGSGVRAASASSIEIDFYFRGVRCKERIKLTPTPRNLKYCENLKARIEHEIATGEFDYRTHFPDSKKAALFATQPGDTLTLGRYLEKWLQDVKPFLKASTWGGYRKIIRGQLVPAFGHLTLSEFRRTHVKEWAMARGMTPKTLGNVVSPLRVALDDAVEDDLIGANPLAGWRIRRRNTGPKTDKVDPFSIEEREAILAALDGQAKNFVQFAFWTGMRTSELVALDWADIDWLRGVIVVSKGLTQAAKGFESPKTEAGGREVKILGPALTALKAQKAHTFLKGEEVFQNPRTGGRWTGDQPIRKTMWAPALKRAGVRYRNPYQTRHTFASTALMAGEHVMWVSRQLGHKDWTFTARTYSRWIPDNAPEAGKKAEEWYTFGQHGGVSN